MIDLSRGEARELAVAAQGLAWDRDEQANKRAVLETVRHLGCVQIDTISVVARSHYLVLWSRLGHYDPRWLDELLSPDRALFEYWAHAASLIPVELYPYFRRRMLRYHTDGWAGQNNWAIDNKHVLDDIRNAIRTHGPISSSHFEREDRDQPVQPWSWWGGKPANRGLDFLWSTGELAIERRVNFQRHYDLTERVLAAWHTEELPDPDHEQNVLARIAVRAQGVAFPRGINDYFRTRWGVRGESGRKPEQILQKLAEAGELIPVTVEHLGPGYVSTQNQALLERVRSGDRAQRTTLLSPFDNLIWDRGRTSSLFDFDYRLECYTPAPKRIYGYFTMPILHGSRLIGRLEPKVDRRRSIFHVQSFHLEPGIKLDESCAAAIATTIWDFARFNGAVEVRAHGAPSILAEALALA